MKVTFTQDLTRLPCLKSLGYMAKDVECWERGKNFTGLICRESSLMPQKKKQIFFLLLVWSFPQREKKYLGTQSDSILSHFKPSTNYYFDGLNNLCVLHFFCRFRMSSLSWEDKASSKKDANIICLQLLKKCFCYQSSWWEHLTWLLLREGPDFFSFPFYAVDGHDQK